MILSKPKFWDNDRWFIAILLLPLSLIVLLVVFLKKNLPILKNLTQI